METQKSSHLLERALVLHQGGDVQSAIQHYREILTQQPNADAGQTHESHASSLAM